jgi:hypothetical protein
LEKSVKNSDIIIISLFCVIFLEILLEKITRILAKLGNVALGSSYFGGSPSTTSK